MEKKELPLWMTPENQVSYATDVLERYATICEEQGEHEEAEVYRKAVELRKAKRKWLRVQLCVGDAPGNAYISDLKPGSMASIMEDLKQLDPGESFHITAVEMTPEEVDALPEFDGF